ncbi:GNAT family N-acetyltransferase [Actinocorallia sp. A-T 12471]|uniref:GNAT family N-acetyltransferase n=1 Tax=Actinocorallia sp. A-T 12471 TaxID=3089813 RepID=UPI0029D24F78|nr:GNAT family N-acetyltransferase [Actinocorallia sp. A-T 12471]MDX6738900.1 GNAT family N-acetyltransferase [Actinocorallia sp. A-T 12471]
MSIKVRSATVADVPVILGFIRDLAEYEKELDKVEATEDDLRAALFGQEPKVFAHIAQDPSGTPVGFALWFLNFSTWTGKHGIYLEDLYVTPEARGGGYGKALLAELARVAVARGYARYEWACLDWNTPSIRFYESLGAKAMNEWTGYRLAGEALRAVAR